LTVQGNSVVFQIRKIIYEKFNDTNSRFTNDAVFEVMKDNGMANSLTIDDMEPYFKQLHDEGLIRPIAQNFTTQWYKLFEKVEKFNCKSCGQDIHLGNLEPLVCPQCKTAI